MRAVTRSVEPKHFAEFHCLGAECEDTCCDGWAVVVDRPTYEKYEHCPDEEWRGRFQQLITINPSNPLDHDYARIQLAGTACPFLSEGLCSIHKKFGEEYLSVTCASFPRVWNAVDEVLEKSMDLSCPEAARRVLLDPEAMRLSERAATKGDFNPARIAAIDTSSDARPGKPYRHFRSVRTFVIRLLQNRTFPLWKRLMILGLFCDKLQEMGPAVSDSQVSELLGGYEAAVSGGLFEEALNQLRAQPGARLEMLLELVIARITADFTNARFRECYKQFMEGIQWGKDSTIQDLCAQYRDAHTRYCEPFLSGQPHILENYLVNYVYRHLFPFGPQETTYKLRDQMIERSIHAEFMLLAVYYSITEMMLCGVAGFHKEAFGAPQVVQVMYACTRAFEHSLTFPQRVLQTIEKKGMHAAAGAAVLLVV